MYPDSIDKIVRSYFGAVTAQAFDYKGEHYPVPELTVSPLLLLRGYTCPMACGGCCPEFTLDYLPSEQRPEGFAHARLVEFDGHDVEVYTIEQLGSDDHRCRFLQRDDGRCGIHGSHPFSCDFELIRTQHSSNAPRVTLTAKLFGRGWNMKRVDGGVGAKCEMLPADPGTVADVVRKLTRLDEWAAHFGLSTRLDIVLDWVAVTARDLDNALALRLPAPTPREVHT